MNSLKSKKTKEFELDNEDGGECYEDEDAYDDFEEY
jgi:hypothetical protein